MTEEARPKRCICGGALDYSAIDGKVFLVCDDCERPYPLKGKPINTGQDLTLDSIDMAILRHVAFVAYCCPRELHDLFSADQKVSYSTIIRRSKRLAKAGYIHLQKKNRHRLFYRRTERLEEMAAEKKWYDSKKKK